MATGNFSNRLHAALATPAPTPYTQALDSLKQVSQSIQDWLSTNVTASSPVVQVEPGFPAAIGQQFNIVVRIPRGSVADTLFRAYITPAGQVSLDFFGEEPVVTKTEAELKEQILDFLARPEVKARLEAYKQLLN